MQYRVLGIHPDASPEVLLIEAPDAGTARRQACASGLLVVEVSGAPSRFVPWVRTRRGGGLASAPFDVDLFCQELLALLTAGVTIGEALETLTEKESQPVARQLLDRLLASIREGKPLSRALAQHPQVFPSLLSESLRAAERTSDYGPALGRFVRYRKLSREVRERLVSASVYPLILLGVSSLVLLFLVGYVVPRFAEVYSDMGDRLPAASRILLQLGQLIGHRPLVAVCLLAGGAAGAVAAVRSPRARSWFMAGLQKVPRLREVLVAADFARLYRTLALLLHGGIPMVSALDSVRGLLPEHLARRLDACRRSVAEGRSFSESMREQALASVVGDRFFRVGEGNGRLAEMIDRAADFHEEQVARGADRLGRVVGPLMMLAMGVVIGVVVVLMYLPIFELAEAVQ
jgi:general secretion pathway protein F